VCYQSELECREECDPKCQLQASLLGSENWDGRLCDCQCWGE
jgi:hypothetical protein